MNSPHRLEGLVFIMVKNCAGSRLAHVFFPSRINSSCTLLEDQHLLGYIVEHKMRSWEAVWLCKANAAVFQNA